MGVMKARKLIARVLADETFDAAVSTGAAVAVAALPIAKRRRIPTHYVESVSRIHGPSLSGRIIATLRCAELWTQHEGWARGRWRLTQNVFSSFQAVDRTPPAERSLFVTLGTIQGYRFDRLIDRLVDTGLADGSTVWQLGFTKRSDLPGSASDMVSNSAFASAAKSAGVVVTHAGVGTILDLLETGVFPIVVPRRRRWKEHVDDHQLQIAELLKASRVAHVVDASELERADVEIALGKRIADE
jgi:UDP-N-acetylglucosamine transferase subunit ALG13